MGKKETKTITTKDGGKLELQKLTIAGFSCACCGTTLNKGDFHACCPDCGAMLCETCAAGNGFEDHACEDEAEFEEEW